MKRKFLVYLLTFLICGLIAFLLYNTMDINKKGKNKEEQPTNNKDTNTSNDTEKTFEDKILGIEINDKMYVMELENSEAAREFLSLTPMTIEMEDLDEVEKYYYLNTSIKGEEFNYLGISKGDVMLYEGNCIVIFYKDSSNDEKYVKIGHINDLDDLEDGSIFVSFVR